MQQEAARGSMRFAKIGARMIRIGTAILLAVFASAAPGQTPPASPSEAETPKAPPTVGVSIKVYRINELTSQLNTEKCSTSCGLMRHTS
jgi:hypothetical protein